MSINPKAKQADNAVEAIVVLGASVWANEQPSPTLRNRTLHAVGEYKRLSRVQSPPVIILSGGLGNNPPSEAKVMARICREAGVPDKQLLLESRSTSTWENAKFSAEYLHQTNAQNLLVVTDRYHLPRALMTFRGFGFECQGSGPTRGANTPLWQKIIMPIREAIAYPNYWVRLRMSAPNALAKNLNQNNKKPDQSRVLRKNNSKR